MNQIVNFVDATIPWLDTRINVSRINISELRKMC